MKEEHRQITNSFKLRGASNTILTNEKIETFVTASTGNHALAVCHILSQVGKKGIIFVTSTIPESKLQKLKKFPFIELKVIEGDPQECFQLAGILLGTSTLKPIFVQSLSIETLTVGRIGCKKICRR